MPNDAKLGLVVGVGLVIAIGVVFFRKDTTPQTAANVPAAATTTTNRSPPPRPVEPTGTALELKEVVTSADADASEKH